MQLILTSFEWVFLIKYCLGVTEFNIRKSQVIQDLRCYTFRSLKTDKTS